MTRLAAVLCALIATNLAAWAGDEPDCTGAQRWPAMSAFVQLKNSGVTDNAKLDWEATKVSRLASERIGEDLYRQIHNIVFTERSGKKIEVITVSDASSEECSMNAVKVFRVQTGESR